MAEILSDKELQKLLGKVIVGGDKDNIKPNSYILRLGTHGEFINTNKEFELGKKKMGIKVQPGHSVGLTALEVIDFRRETVREIFPENDLHGLLSPTTDLSREGIVAPTTQIDAGYHGTLNWTITNTSSVERRFVFKENIFRLTIFKLGKNESPDNLYEGAYQSQVGYVRSRRAGAPVGMRDDEWIDPIQSEGPEKLLDTLVNSGYPWNLLGKRLKIIDDQFKDVTNEYANIFESINEMKGEVTNLTGKYTDLVQRIPQSIRDNLKDEASSLQNRWLMGAASLAVALIGIILTILSNESAIEFFTSYGTIVGLVLIIISCLGLYLMSRDKK